MARPSHPTDGLGGRIRQARIEAGWTLQQLADAAGYTAPYISKIENNRVHVTPKTLAKLAAALGTEAWRWRQSAADLPPAVVKAFYESPDAFFVLARMTRGEREAFVGAREQRMG